MEAVAVLIGILVDILKIEFTIWGFTLSFWSIMLSMLVSGIVIALIVGFFRD